MSNNLYNFRLRTGMEIISEMLSIDEVNELDPGVSKLFTDDESDKTVILSHPIVVVTIPVTRDGEVFLENFYHPYLQHAKHACATFHVDDIMSIDELHEDAHTDYIDAVIAIYGHLYEDSEQSENSDSPTVH